MAKKRWPVFVGLSVVVGVASSILFKKQTKDIQARRKSLIKLYSGHWWFIDQIQKIQHDLDINDELDLIIDGRQFKPELLELTEKQLILRDEYGYHLIFSQVQGNKIHFYDEADDQTYILEQKTEQPD